MHKLYLIYNAALADSVIHAVSVSRINQTLSLLLQLVVAVTALVQILKRKKKN